MVTVDLLLNFNDSHMAILQTLIPRGLGVCQRDPIMQVSHGEANFIFTLRNYSTFTPGSFGVQPCTAPCSCSSSICAASYGAGEWNHTYSFIGQPTDEN